MRKKYFSAVLFGALLCVSGGTFTSCSDYDDDISSLKEDIKTNATDLSGLIGEKVTNIEAEISALKSTQSQMEDAYKAADTKLAEAIEAAGNKAAEDATVKANAAEVSAVAAAQKLVDEAIEKLEASLDQTRTDLGLSIDALKEDLKKSNSEVNTKIEDLVKTDATLTEAISKAQAAADKANDIVANLTIENIDGLKESLSTINKTLESQQTMLGQLNGQITTINNTLAGLEAQKVALSEYNTKMSDLDAKDTNLQDQITEMNKLIGDLTAAAGGTEIDIVGFIKSEVAKVQSSLDSYKSAQNVTLTNMQDAYEDADQKLQDSIDVVAKNLAALDTKVNTLAGKVSGINDQLNVLKISSLKAVTGIIKQASTYELCWGTISSAAKAAAVNSNIIFPYNGATSTEKIPTSQSYIVDADGGYLFVTINPNTIDINGEVLSLENSLGKAPSRIALGGAVAADESFAITNNGVVARTVSDNGLWKLPIVISGNSNPTEIGDSENPYAIVATSTHDVIGKDKDGNDSAYKVRRRVFSKYDVQLPKKSSAVAAVSSFSLTVPNATGLTGENMKTSVKTSLMTNSYKSKKVYRQYLEVYKASDYNTTTMSPNAGKKAITDGSISGEHLNKIFSGDVNAIDEANDIVVTPALANVDLVAVWYIQNYDGTIVKSAKTFVATQTLLVDEKLAIDATPNAAANMSTGSLALTNTVKAEGFDGLNFISSNLFTDNVQNFTIKVKNASGSYVATNDFAITHYKETSLINSISNSSRDLKLTNGAKITYNANAFSGFGDSKELQISYFDVNGRHVNNLYITVTLVQPKKDALASLNDRTEAAFKVDGEMGNKAIAWAAAVTNGTVEYKLEGAFNHVYGNVSGQLSGFPSGEYVFVDRTTSYSGSEAVYAPTFNNAHNAKTITVNTQAVKDEKVYKLSEAADYFGTWLTTGNVKKFVTSFDNFELVFQSPIKYANLEANTIELPYASDITLDNASFKNCQDPSVAYQKFVKFFSGFDSRIAKYTATDAEVISGARVADAPKITLSVNSASAANVGLLKITQAGAAGTIKIESTTLTAIRENVTMKMDLHVTDIYGITSIKTFNIIVKKQ